MEKNPSEYHSFLSPFLLLVTNNKKKKILNFYWLYAFLKKNVERTFPSTGFNILKHIDAQKRVKKTILMLRFRKND